MPTTSCPACGGLVNEAVIKCPHCGEKQERGAPVYSKAEIQALIDNDDALQAHTGSSALLKALLLPHKHTRGLMRVLELALTAVAAPAVIVGAICMFLVARRRPGRVQGVFSTSGEIASVVVMTILGGIPIAMWLGGTYAIAAIAALWARAAVRMISAGRAERAMLEADRQAPRSALAPSRAQVSQGSPAPTSVAAPASVSAPQLPAARARPSAPMPPAPMPPAPPAPPGSDARPSAPLVGIVDPAKARAAAQAQPRPSASPEPSSSDGDEPSILR